jgi:hypothetical protein
MQRTRASAGSRSWPVLAFVICGCGSDPAPVAPPGRASASTISRSSRDRLRHPVVEARTTDSTYRAVTNGAGGATIRIANEVRLPGRLCFTIDGAAITPTAALATTDAGTDARLRIHCDGRRARCSCARPRCITWATSSATRRPTTTTRAEGAQLVLPFTLLAIPAHAHYRLRCGGSGYVELRSTATS